MALLHRETKQINHNNLPAPSAQPRVKKISYKYLLKSPFQYREEKREDVEYLAASIQTAGKVIVPLTVYAAGDNENYILKTGHHRVAACRYLVEEKGLSEYAMLPCIIEPKESDAMTEIEVLGSNHFIPETEAEKVYASARYAELIQSVPEVKARLKSEVGGNRTVEIIANKTGRSKTSIIEDLQLNNKLSDLAKEDFKADNLTRKAALELTKLDPAAQDELISSGNTSYKAIRKITSPVKQERKERYHFMDISEVAPDIPADTDELDSKGEDPIKDVSPASAAILAEEYKEKLSRYPDAPDAKRIRWKLIITALDDFSKRQ